MTDAEALRALMEADRWIDRVISQRDHLPESEELANLEGQLRIEVVAIRDAESAVAPMRATYEEVAARADRIQRRRRELETALAASTSGARDLAAMQHELESISAQGAEADEEALGLLESIEERDSFVERLRRDIKPKLARREEFRSTIEQLRSSLDEEVASLRVARDERARDVPENLRIRYQRAMDRVGTSGAAQIVTGRCDGCRIALAPLDLDRAKNQDEDSFMDCPSCGRILVP